MHDVCYAYLTKVNQSINHKSEYDNFSTFRVDEVTSSTKIKHTRKNNGVADGTRQNAERGGSAGRIAIGQF